MFQRPADYTTPTQCQKLTWMFQFLVDRHKVPWDNTARWCRKFLRTCQQPVFWVHIHAPYIVNLASKEARVRNNQSKFCAPNSNVDHSRCAAMMAHLGSASGVGEAAHRKLAIGNQNPWRLPRINTISHEISAGSGSYRRHFGRNCYDLTELAIKNRYLFWHCPRLCFGLRCAHPNRPQKSCDTLMTQLASTAYYFPLQWLKSWLGAKRSSRTYQPWLYWQMVCITRPQNVNLILETWARRSTRRHNDI